LESLWKIKEYEYTTEIQIIQSKLKQSQADVENCSVTLEHFKAHANGLEDELRQLKETQERRRLEKDLKRQTKSERAKKENENQEKNTTTKNSQELQKNQKELKKAARK